MLGLVAQAGCVGFAWQSEVSWAAGMVARRACRKATQEQVVGLRSAAALLEQGSSVGLWDVVGQVT